MINASDHEGDQQKDGPNTEPTEKRKRQLTIKALQNVKTVYIKNFKSSY